MHRASQRKPTSLKGLSPTLRQILSNPRVASIPPGFEAVDRRTLASQTQTAEIRRGTQAPSGQFFHCLGVPSLDAAVQSRH